MKKILVGIDPGSSICGVCFLEGNQIIEAFNLEYSVLWNKIKEYYVKYGLSIIIEDIRPYSMRLTPQVIDTCKMIGEMVYRLKAEFKITPVLVSRAEVKKWVFDAFPAVCGVLIEKKIDKQMFLACRLEDREPVWVDTNGKSRRKQSFIFVDDRIVVESMKWLYGIEMPPPGYGYKFGLKDHSWQALAAVSFFIHKEQK